MDHRGIGLGHPVGNGDVFCAALFGIFHQAHDFRQKRAVACCRYTDAQGGRYIGCSCENRCAGLDLGRDAFTGNHTGVDI